MALQYILLMERSLPVVQHVWGPFLHAPVAVLKVLLLRLFSDVCCRKSSCADVLRQGQMCLHKILAAEKRVKSTPRVI